MTVLAATSSPSAFWYLTRGSGIVTLLLLTVSVAFGVATARRLGGARLPRFVVAGLHRNVTLLALVFLAVHVLTTIADGYAPIGLKDAFVPFLSPYRPLWLGLGALAFDLLLAIVVTSLLRARFGHRIWRATHWLAYLSWPLALVHAFGTGSDARFNWMAVIGFGCIAVVVGSVIARVRSLPRNVVRPVLAATLVPSTLFAAWYLTGPGRAGWASRAGTPQALVHSAAQRPSGRLLTATRSVLPATFNARLSGRLTQSPVDGSGLVTVRIDGSVRGSVTGTLRLALRGFPTDDGGVSMTSSGVAFRAGGKPPLYEGSIAGLEGNRVAAQLSAGSAGSLSLLVVLQIDPRTSVVSGSVYGTQSR